MGTQGRKILDLTPGLVESLPGACSCCCFWEAETAGAPGECLAEGGKGDWVARCLSEGFSPGKLLVAEGKVLAYAQYASLQMVPRLQRMPFPLPTPGAFYLTCVYVEPVSRGTGMGRLLLDSLLSSLHGMRAKALETHGLPMGRGGPPGPLGFFSSCGFKEISPHPAAPLMRIDMRTLAPLQDGVQYLLGRLPQRAPVKRPRPLPRS